MAAKSPNSDDSEKPAYAGIPNEKAKDDDSEKVQRQSGNTPGEPAKWYKNLPAGISKRLKSWRESLTTPTIVVDPALRYRSLLEDLDLEPNSKLTLKKARTVDNHTLKDDKLTSPGQIPNYILNKLMIVNHHAREFELKCVNADKDTSKDSDSDSSNAKYGINPMDALVAIFHCSDYFLRRDIAIKLSACQLSVPFLLPDPAEPSEKVTIFLSALEGITKHWGSACDNSKSAREVFATEYPFPVVSFIRIGKNNMSKSSLMNKIMSGGNGAHDVFYHKDMKGGNFERKVVDGLVELGWYLPDGNEREILHNEICFANLRGDGMDFKKQLDVMLKISSVLCLLLPSENPNKTTKTILDRATSSQTKVILIFNEENQKGANRYFSNLKDSNREKVNLITRTSKGNEYEFLRSIQEGIQQSINVVEAVPLIALASCVSEFNIHLDSKQSHSRFERRMDTWLKMGAKDAKDLLKLQTHVPVLADLEREIHNPRRNNKGDDRNEDEIFAEVEEETKKQKKSFTGMDERIRKCLDDIAVMNVNDRNYALTKLKHQLNKMSLHIMATLHEEYHIASINFQRKKAKKRQMSEAISSEEKRLKQLEESISRSSFGLEHILRELAQLYQLSDSSTNDYAGAAAEMLLSGHPLELVDGDSSYIPLQWFDAVYTELEHKTSNAKIFVISVLGIQSSGKSTMLNTMFGLEFPVSAGRCTRGAFASLIPVSDFLKDKSNFDYVLIIDTEGLRGYGNPHLREHDNELSTFAIGVADITIVNIFGENHGKMKEFLEIAVHAFLKMKLAKEKKYCKIVHQNVAAADAKTKLAVERFNLKEDLDKMTKLAASQENFESQFQEFNDIISFDENKDVFYIPSFLKGSPPMAPVSPNYGRAIQKVKDDIISMMCAYTTQNTVSQFRERVDTLWKAMLKENFIFSFRNTIEVRAYTSLDQKYFEEYVNFLIGTSQLENKIQIVLKRPMTRSERDSLWEENQMQIRNKVEELGKKMKSAMEDFFATNEDKETLEQWKENIMNRIKHQKENKVTEVTQNCFGTFLHKQSLYEVDKMKEIYKKDFIEKAREFIISRHDMENELDSRHEFEQEWKKWIEKVPQCEESKVNVNHAMRKVLCNTDPRLNARMTEKIGQQGRSIEKFKNIAPVIDIDHLSIAYVHQVLNFLLQQQQQCLSTAKMIKDKAIECGINFAKQLLKSDVRCKPDDLTQMYQIVITPINKEVEKHSFKFNEDMKCDILLYTFASVYKIFDEMEERYFQERNIRNHLNTTLRPEVEEYFLNLCNKMEKDVLAATAIAYVLQKPIESELNRTMGPAVQKIILKKSKFQSKAKFHASVLIQLGQEAQFKSYIPYLENPVKFLKTNLKKSIEIFCLKDEKSSVESLLEKEAKDIKDKVFNAISTASDKLRESKNKKLTVWIEPFAKACSSITLEITKEMFAVAGIDVNDLQDVHVFEDKVRECVAQFIQSLINDGVNYAVMEKWSPSPYDHLLTTMFGCQCYCPFCKALCDNIFQNHAGRNHSTKIHRPIGLNSYRYITTGILGIEICPALVGSNIQFRNTDTSGEKHPFKKYSSVNNYYESWSIPEEASLETSNYWQWFTAEFSKELSEFHNAKQPKIPLGWRLLKFKNIKEQLLKEYKLPNDI